MLITARVWRCPRMTLGVVIPVSAYYTSCCERDSVNAAKHTKLEVHSTKFKQTTGQEVSAKKLLALSVASSARGKPVELQATLDGVETPVQQEFR